MHFTNYENRFTNATTNPTFCAFLSFWKGNVNRLQFSNIYKQNFRFYYPTS